MAFVNYMAREICFRIVYAGPSRAGKTTNIAHLATLFPTVRGKRDVLSSIADLVTHDFVAPKLKHNGFDVRVAVATVNVPITRDRERRAALKGVDGVVFVADSDRNRLDA